MSKLALTNRIPHEYNRQSWFRILSDIETQVNALSEMRIQALINANTSAPTTGKHQKGDFVRNTNPATLGTTPNRYVVYGWICTAEGEPGTWQECRFGVGDITITPTRGAVVFTGFAPTIS